MRCATSFPVAAARSFRAPEARRGRGCLTRIWYVYILYAMWTLDRQPRLPGQSPRRRRCAPPSRRGSPEHGLTAPQWATLMRLLERDGWPQKELGQSQGMDKATIGGVVAAARSQGTDRARRRPRRRAHPSRHLTAAGRKLARALRPLAERGQRPRDGAARRGAEAARTDDPAGAGARVLERMMPPPFLQGMICMQTISPPLPPRRPCWSCAACICSASPSSSASFVADIVIDRYAENAERRRS